MYILLGSVVIDILLTLTGQCSHTMLIIGTSLTHVMCNYVPPALFSCRDQHFMMLNHPVETSVGSTPTPCTQNELNRLSPAHSVNHHLLAISSWSSAREIGMCLCGDNHFHVYTSTEGRKLSSPRHFK